MRTSRSKIMRAVAGLICGAAIIGGLLGAQSVQAQSAGSVIAGPFTVTLPSTNTIDLPPVAVPIIR